MEFGKLPLFSVLLLVKFRVEVEVDKRHFFSVLPLEVWEVYKLHSRFFAVLHLVEIDKSHLFPVLIMVLLVFFFPVNEYDIHM